MPIQIMPRETNWGESLGTGLGSGLGEGLQQLANMKMKEYAQRQQAGKNKAFIKAMNPNMSEQQAEAFAGGSPGLQQLSLKQQLQAQDPSRMAFAKGVASLVQPQQQGQQAQQQGQQEGLQQLLGQMNPRDALALLTYQQNAGNKANEAAQKTEEQQMKFTKDIEPWLTKEDTLSNQINEMGGYAAEADKLLDEIGPKNYPSLLGRGLAEISGGWLYPSVKELQNKVGELALAKASSLKGQPTNFKIRLVQSIKPGLSADYKANKRMLRRYADIQEAHGNRQAFRDNLKVNGQFPTNIESIMSEYDNAMNRPEKHRSFFDKYPGAKDDAYFLSKGYEAKKMAEEDEKYGENGPKKETTAKPTKPLNQLTDEEVLSNPSWFSKDAVYDDKKGKGHRLVVENGTKKWKDL